MSELSSQELEVAELLIKNLNLDITPEELDPDAPLFYEGLGLDSIDALQLSIAITERYGFRLRSDDPDNVEIFSSLRSLARHVEKMQAK